MTDYMKSDEYLVIEDAPNDSAAAYLVSGDERRMAQFGLIAFKKLKQSLPEVAQKMASDVMDYLFFKTKGLLRHESFSKTQGLLVFRTGSFEEPPACEEPSW
jgi:hypothetical protein